MTYSQRLRNYVVDQLRANPDLHVQVGLETFGARDFAERLTNLNNIDEERIGVLEAIARSIQRRESEGNGSR